MTLAFDDILAAQARLKGHIERTPCRHSRTLSEITGAQVWVKFENLQFTAAYKERGALNKLLLLGENVRARGVIAASAGNHSQGLAYHAARLGIPVTIVMPKATPFMKVQQTRAHGAEVVNARGTLEGCSIVSEDPGDMGFGDAALKMSKLFKMRPMSKDGQPVDGGTVRIPLRFVLPKG